MWAYLRSQPRKLSFLLWPGRALVAILLTWPLRPLLEQCCAGAIEILRGEMDVGFYLRQVATPRLRRSAARAPQLHYLLLGQYLDYSPQPSFDARYYRLTNRDIPGRSCPFLHYVQQGRAEGRPAHAAGPSPPPGSVARAAAGDVALLLEHGRGGGSSRFLDFYARRLLLAGGAVVRMRRAAGRNPLYVIDPPASLAVTPRWFEPFAGDEALAAFARQAGVGKLVINHLIDLPEQAFASLPRLARRIGASYELLLHDYYYLCPRVDLVDTDGRYCGVRTAAGCGACLGQARAPQRGIDAALWRARAGELLRGAARVVAPSADLARRLGAYFPGVAIQVLEPEDDAQLPPERIPSIDPNAPLHLAVIGALNRAKGYDVVTALARLASHRKAPLRLSLLGHSIDDGRLRRLGVEVTGRYLENEAEDLLRASGAHAAFIPAIWPETWSFVQTIALRQALPVFAFDHGAVAQRLRRLRRSTLLPPSLSADEAALLHALLAFRASWLAAAGRPA
ncbi:MAG: hypothetical protein ISP90_03525 [Nevskia sp.]|nr:hypothetical protein [Nevskia sp.]